MANKSGYFKDREGNKLYGATLGENVFLTDGTDLETKLNNIIASLQYNKGDSFTRSTNIHCAGKINNAGTHCLFTLPLSKPIAEDVTSISITLGGSPLAYVSNGNLGIKTGTYSGTVVEDGIGFTVELTTATTTNKGAIANAILANRTITFS